MKMIFNYDANKTHFHSKGFALSLVLKVKFLELGNGLLYYFVAASLHPLSLVDSVCRRCAVARAEFKVDVLGLAEFCL